MSGSTPWRAYVRHLAKWALIVIAFLIFSQLLIAGILHAR